MAIKGSGSPMEAVDEYFDMLIKSRFIEMFGDLKQESPWESYKLSELFDLTMGKTPSRDTPKYWSNGVYPWVSISDITSSNGVINDTKEKISEDAVAESGIKQIDAGTVLMSFKLSIGKTALTKFPLYTNEAIVAFVPKKSEVINNSFLQEWIKEKNWNEGSNKAVKGATLNKATLKEMRIHIPPIRLQNQFADFVGQVNKSKRTYKRIFESFDNLVKSRFIEMFGDIKTNSKRWKCHKLGELGSFKTGGTPSSKHEEYYQGTIPFISTPALGPNYIDDSAAKYHISKEAIENCATTLIPAGSLIIGTRINVGQSSINKIPMCTNQDIVSMMDIDKKYDLLFLKHCLNQYIPYLDSQKKGATIKGITVELLKSVMIPEPPIDEQKQYVDFVEQVDKSKFVETVEPDHPAVFQNIHGFPSFGLIST